MIEFRLPPPRHNEGAGSMGPNSNRLGRGIRFVAGAAALLLLAACASYTPQPYDRAALEGRAVAKEEDGLTISAVALGPDEAAAVFGVPTFSEDIQPVWVRVTNERARDVTLLPLFFDAIYYTPAEAAFIHHGWLTGETNRQIDRAFTERALPLRVPAGATVEGYLYGTADLGQKALNFIYVGDGEAIHSSMVVPVPGLAIESVDLDTIYAPAEIRNIDDPAELRAAIEALPCCVTDKSGETEADPLNFVLLADATTGLTAMIAGGWDRTEGVTGATAIETTLSFLFGTTYRYSPVSNLYVFGRKQDAAFQIARGDIHERNHLRLWLTPLRFRGTPVWIGAISRDIGVIRSGFGTTHKIDPAVDEERWYLAQSLARAQALKRFAYAGGGPVSTSENPRSSVDPQNVFYSDGLRIVMELSDTPVALDEIERIRWVDTGSVRPTAAAQDAGTSGGS